MIRLQFNIYAIISSAFCYCNTHRFVCHGSDSAIAILIRNDTPFLMTACCFRPLLNVRTIGSISARKVNCFSAEFICDRIRNTAEQICIAEFDRFSRTLCGICMVYQHAGCVGIVDQRYTFFSGIFYSFCTPYGLIIAAHCCKGHNILAVFVLFRQKITAVFLSVNG